MILLLASQSSYSSQHLCLYPGFLFPSNCPALSTGGILLGSISHLRKPALFSPQRRKKTHRKIHAKREGSYVKTHRPGTGGCQKDTKPGVAESQGDCYHYRP